MNTKGGVIYVYYEMKITRKKKKLKKKKIYDERIEKRKAGKSTLSELFPGSFQ